MGLVSILASIAGAVVIALAAWMVLEQILFRALPMLERVLPDDICGPDGWFCDTHRKTGIFDLPMKRRQG